MGRLAVAVFERSPEGAHGWGEVGELQQVSLDERIELVCSEPGEPDPNDALVVSVGVALDQPVCDRAVDQPDGAVMAQDEVLGDLADRRPGGVGVAANRQKQLVLCGRQPELRGPVLAPA